MLNFSRKDNIDEENETLESYYLLFGMELIGNCNINASNLNENKFHLNKKNIECFKFNLSSNTNDSADVF